MWEVSQEAQIALAHRVRRVRDGEARDCLHGHNWRIVAVAQADALDDDGLVIDVELLGEHLHELLRKYDHALLNEVAPFDRRPCTAEAFAFEIADALAGRVEDGRVRLARVEVWEGYIRKATYLRA